MDLQVQTKGTKKKVEDAIKSREHAEEKKYRTDMDTIQKKLEVDSNFCKKFGHLKKAAVLFYYGRENDAFDEIAKAAAIVAEQQKIDEEKNEAIQRRWKFKLGIDDGLDISALKIEKFHPDDISNKMIAEAAGSIPISTMRVFLEQISPFRNSQYSKDVFLNKCIEDDYLKYWDAIKDRQKTISKMKKQVSRLDKEVENLEMYGSDENPEFNDDAVDEEGKPLKLKKKKTKMCEDFMKKGECQALKDKQRYERLQNEKKLKQNKYMTYQEMMESKGHKLTERSHVKCLPEEVQATVKIRKENDDSPEKDFGERGTFDTQEDHERETSEDRKRRAGCSFAHNPIELELIPLKKKIENLNSMIKQQDRKLKHNTTQKHWAPAGFEPEDSKYKLLKKLTLICFM